MALLAEELVEEWLNRKGYFTIRGVKKGVSEIDLLAIKYDDSIVDAQHIEVQISFNPVTYITPLSKRLTKLLNKNKRSALARDSSTLEESVEEWINTKYIDSKKCEMRDSLWPGVSWKYILVHGVVKHPAELELISSKGIKLIPLHKVLSDLCEGKLGKHSSTGGDLVDLIGFYSKSIMPSDNA